MGQIKRRQVFYIPGYDPIHPRRYRELYRSEGADQAKISGYDINLSPKPSGGRYGWTVDAKIDDQETQADFQVLVWSDIVRGSMETGIIATYIQLVRTAWIYIGSGALRRLMWLRKGPVIAALYPIFFLLIQLALAVGVMFALTWLSFQIVDLAIEYLNGPHLFGPYFVVRTGLAWMIGIGAAVYTLHWFRKHDNRFFAYYLMHDYSYSARSKGANPPELEARMAEFADDIAKALRDDVDEVLVVGHSSGAHLAVSILADIIRDGRVTNNGPTLGLLTLGQVVPMVSFLPKADRLRCDLRFLSEQDALFWVDVTAPGDGCAFALCDPVAVSGVATDKQKWPLVFSAAFTQTLSPARWKELKRRYFRLHFQYLCAFDRPKDYDYFQITAGPMSLADRYTGRPASKSRLTIAASKYTSVTP